MPNYTLVISEDTAERIKKLNKFFGCSVGGFAAAHVTDLAMLAPPHVLQIRQNIAELADAERAKLERKSKANGEHATTHAR